MTSYVDIMSRLPRSAVAKQGLAAWSNAMLDNFRGRHIGVEITNGASISAISDSSPGRIAAESSLDETELSQRLGDLQDPPAIRWHDPTGRYGGDCLFKRLVQVPCREQRYCKVDARTGDPARPLLSFGSGDQPVYNRARLSLGRRIADPGQRGRDVRL